MDLFLSFNGRINRAKWWLGFLVLFVVQIVLWFILGAVFGLSTMGSFDPNDPAAAGAMVDQMMSGMIPMLILFAIFLYPALALYAKRWHDRNKSGWWSLIMLVPMVGAIWILIELGILRGTDGDNKYGPDPLA